MGDYDPAGSGGGAARPAAPGGHSEAIRSRRRTSARRWAGAADEVFRVSRPQEHAAAADGELTRKHDAKRFRIDPVLLAQDARRERVHGVIVQDGDRRLKDDRPGVEILVDEVDRAS